MDDGALLGPGSSSSADGATGRGEWKQQLD